MVNSTAKFQTQAGTVLLKYGLQSSKWVPPLFKEIEAVKLVILVTHILDDLKVASSGNNSKSFLGTFHSNFKLGTIKRGPVNLMFFGLDILQNENM